MSDPAPAGAYATVGVCFAVSFIVTAIRFYNRIHSGLRHGVGDLAIIVSLILQAGLVTLGILQMLSFRENNMAYMNKLFLLGTCFYILTAWSVKVSINLLHIQLTRNMGFGHKLAVASLVFVGTSGLALMLLEIFSCWPISRRFKGWGVEGCNEYRNDIVFWALTALNISSDLILCGLPYPVLRKIMERRLRLATYAVFTLAALAMAVSIIRTILISTNPANFRLHIILVANIECCMRIVLSAVPGISSVFIQKYAHNTTYIHPKYTGSSKQTGMSTELRYIHVPNSPRSWDVMKSPTSPSVDFVASKDCTVVATLEIIDEHKEIEAQSSSSMNR